MKSDKGKKPAGKSSGKRKLDDDKTGGAKKRKNRGVLQFFDDAAVASDGDYSSGDSIFDDDDFFEEEEFDLGTNSKNDQPKSHDLPVFPKEEELFEEEFDKMMEERYKNASAFLRFAEDEPAVKRFVEEDSSMPSITDPITWKVKCAVGRERHSTFCLMQKYVDFLALGNKLQIISAYAVEHVKGHFFIEADKQSDVIESCKGLCSVYATRVAPVPRSEVPHLLSVRSRRAEISVGMWARVKAGTYKGDLAQLVAVNDAKRRVTVKLIPRIDLHALAEKFGGGVTLKRTGAPAPKLISSSELDEFRPLIQYRRDRETGKMFEVLDGLMLKDGYMYKRVSIDSLSFWGVTPSEEELLKFQPPENSESSEVEWLAQLYGDKKKKRTVKYEKVGEKGEGSSGSSSGKKYELYDLVALGRKDFGLIVGIEKDDYKILKEGAEGHIVQNVGVHEIKNGPFEGRFTAMDRHSKPISVNDTVRILEGPLKDRQGIVRQIYRGIIFIYDENESENGGYICSKAQCCEKIKLSVDSFPRKGGEPSPFGFDDVPSSPKSPLSPEKPWQGREDKRDFNQGERDGFSVGQTLRIRIGPLKGFICRVIAVRRSDVTVKLDSQHRVLTVKSEHLAEVRARSSATSMREESDSAPVKPFDLLGNEGSTDWTGGPGPSSAPWSSWSGLPSTGHAMENNSADPSSSRKDAEDDAWGSKVAPKEKSSWGTPAVVSSEDGDTWNKAAAKGTSSGSGLDGWAKALPEKEDSALPSKAGGESWGNAAGVNWHKNSDANSNEDNGWNKQKASTGNPGSSWNSWDKQGGAGGSSKDGSSWGNANQKMKSPVACSSEETKGESGGWTSWKKPESSLDNEKAGSGSDGWGKGGGFSEEQGSGSSAWNKPKDGFEQDGGSSWNKDGGSWKKQDRGSFWGKSAGGNTKDGDALATKHDSDSWGKTDVGASWNKDTGGGSSWKKSDEGASWGNQGGSSRWAQQGGGSSWNQQTGGSFRDNGGNDDQNETFGGHGGRRGRGGRFDRGRGRRGDRGRGGRGGRFDRGRSFGQDQSSEWKDGDDWGGRDSTGGNGKWSSGAWSGERGSWSSNPSGSSGGWNKGGSDDQNQTESWKKPNCFGSDRGSTWGGTQEKGSSWGNQGGGGGSWKDAGEHNNTGSGGASWGKDRDSSGGWNRAEGWNTTKASDGGNSLGNGSSGGWKKPEGESWGKKEDNGGGNNWGNASGSSGGWKKDEGRSWDKKEGDAGAGNNNWGNASGSSRGWKKGEGKSWDNKEGDAGAGDNNWVNAGGSSGGWKKGEGKSWDNKEGDAGAGNNNWVSAGGSSGGWKKGEGKSWGNTEGDAGAGNNNWGNAGGSSGGWKKGEGKSWDNKEGDAGAGNNNWGNAGGSSGGWMKAEGKSWDNKEGDTGAGNSNWGKASNSSGGWKKHEGEPWRKEDPGRNAWNKEEGKKNDAGGSSWNKGGGSWNDKKQQEDSSWESKQGGGGGGSSWTDNKQGGGGSSWEAGNSSPNGNGRGEERSGGGWGGDGGGKGNKDKGGSSGWAS